MNGIIIYMGMHINHENMYFTQVLVKSGLNLLCCYCSVTEKIVIFELRYKLN